MTILIVAETGGLQKFLVAAKHSRNWNPKWSERPVGACSCSFVATHCNLSGTLICSVNKDGK